MKKGLFLFACLISIVSFSRAQFLDLKGVTVQANSNLYIENNEPKSIAIDQCYVISFKDQMLTHVIYDAGIVKNSQMYKLDVSAPFMNGDVTVFNFKATSGVSGSKYGYELRIDKDGKLVSLVVTQPDGIVKDTYKGGISDLRTFKQ